MDTFVLQFFVSSTWLNQESYNSEIARQKFLVLSILWKYEKLKMTYLHATEKITKPKEFASYLYNI